MYQNKFVVAIKHDGKILREIGDVVKLPFGSEFTVLVKNLNSRRAKFDLHIDGTDVLGGRSIVVNANSESEIKRFVTNNNSNVGNAFKFIERTQKIEDGPRGIKSDDGIVRVEWWFEKELPEVKTTIHNDVYRSGYFRDPYYWYTFGGPYLGAVGQNITSEKMASGTSADIRSMVVGLGEISGSASAASYSTSTDSYSVSNAVQQKVPQLEETLAGITVPGSKVEQEFKTVYGFNSEAQSQVMILRLVGKTDSDVKIIAPVTVKTKQRCVTCSHLNKANAKFCSECGTALDIM